MTSNYAYSIIALDPGPEKTGVVCLEKHGPTLAMELPTSDVLKLIETAPRPVTIACEGIQSYGMPVGKSTFETCYVIGEYRLATRRRKADWMLIYRPDVKLYFCHSPRAKDANVRQALLDLFPATGGGKTPQVGTKKQPGPLYGVKGHMWSALAIAIYARDHIRKQSELF